VASVKYNFEVQSVWALNLNKIHGVNQIMSRDISRLAHFLRAGIDQEVSAQDFELGELGQLIGASVQGKAMLYIRDSDQLERLTG
jgi:hypothetical protein